MTADTDLSLLRRDVQYLLDRTAIHDCIALHARGCDRHDADLISAAYHQDGVDEHGFAINSGPDYGHWANKTHAETSIVHTHNITTHSCESTATQRMPRATLSSAARTDHGSAQLITGRDLDRSERRHGERRIAVRRSTVEGTSSRCPCVAVETLRKRVTSSAPAIATTCPTNGC